jgi:hypothetical protein
MYGNESMSTDIVEETEHAEEPRNYYDYGGHQPVVFQYDYEDQERDSPIVKHYFSIRNSGFVTCVNSDLSS